MRYLFFTNTPAHVHLYKHAVEELRVRGHDVAVLARDYGCTVPLLEYHDLPYSVYGHCDTTKGSLIRELPSHYRSIVSMARAYDPDLVLGVGAYSAHAGAVSRTPAVLVQDSEPSRLDQLVSRPFARSILTPHAFRTDLGPKHYEFTGFKESAYLHPDVFESDPSVRADLGLDPDERFVILRFNAFGSHHDVSESGLSPEQRTTLVDRLSEHATVLVSDEGDATPLSDLDARPFDIHPARLHDALAEADLLVADTQTMVTEAALLGTPAIRSNSFVGEDDMGNFLELERHGLIYNVADGDAVVDRALDVLSDPSAGRRWRRRRDDYVDGMVNLTDVIVETATNRGVVDSVTGVRSRRPRPSAAADRDSGTPQ